ncbi:MAG: hypothetical protein SVX38_13645 [Chloroflexota bacterium]|nr:hypothetical protein [Chloroflexota bacterium]
METFTAIKGFVHNPHYHEQRRRALDRLDIDAIDEPIVQLVNNFAKLPYCFTLQSCWGHFLYEGQKDPNNTEALPISAAAPKVEYRIAYIALCLQDSDSGRALFQDLRAIASLNPKDIQFGCAEWFWERQVNSYALQVEPERYKTKDRIVVSYQEALHIERIRNEFFGELGGLIERRSLESRLTLP